MEVFGHTAYRPVVPRTGRVEAQVRFRRREDPIIPGEPVRNTLRPPGNGA